MKASPKKKVAAKKVTKPKKARNNPKPLTKAELDRKIQSLTEIGAQKATGFTLIVKDNGKGGYSWDFQMNGVSKMDVMRLVMSGLAE